MLGNAEREARVPSLQKRHLQRLLQTVTSVRPSNLPLRQRRSLPRPIPRKPAQRQMLNHDRPLNLLYGLFAERHAGRPFCSQVTTAPYLLSGRHEQRGRRDRGYRPKEQKSPGLGNLKYLLN